MADFETTYDAEATIPGTTIELGRVLMGDCWSGMPAVVIETAGYRYPDTEAEYEEYGARIPLLADIEIGCVNYNRLRDLPMPVEMQNCEGCPSMIESSN